MTELSRIGQRLKANLKKQIPSEPVFKEIRVPSMPRLGDIERFILAVLHHYGSLDQEVMLKELSKILNISQGDIVRTLISLESRGFIRRNENGKIVLTQRGLLVAMTIPYTVHVAMMRDHILKEVEIPTAIGRLEVKVKELDKSLPPMPSPRTQEVAKMGSGTDTA